MSTEVVVAPCPTSSIYCESHPRLTEMLKLRKAGMSFREIGAMMNIAHETVRTYLGREIDRLVKERRSAACEIVEMELLRLDAMHAGLWPMAEAGNVKAIEACLKLMERRARLLGLDAPSKETHRVIYDNMTDAELIDQAQRFGIEAPEVLQLEDLRDDTGAPSDR